MSTTQTTEAREALAAWLRQGRTVRKLSLEDVAKVTKIQPRILEKLERGELEGLPADVFVRGFVRSFAKCVGLDEREAVIRYGACQSAEAAASPTARALVESMGLAKKKPEVLAPAAAAPTAGSVAASPAAGSVAASPAAGSVAASPAAGSVVAAPIVAAPVAGTAVVAAPDSVAAAPESVATAPVATAPVVAAPVAGTAVARVVTAAPVLTAAPAVTAAPVVDAAVAKTLDVEISLAASRVAVAVEPVANDVGPGANDSDEPIIEIAAASAARETTARETTARETTAGETAARETTSKKKKRGGKKNNRRNKKSKQQTELAVAVDTDDEALTNQMVRVDASVVDGALESSVVDGSVEEPNLAEGSQRISTGKIQAVLADGTDVRPVDTRIADDVAAAEAAAGEVAAGEAAAAEAAAAEFAAGEVAAGEVASDEAAKVAEVLATDAADRAASETSTRSIASMQVDASTGDMGESIASDSTAGSWQPTMPPISTTPSVPWRRPSITTTSPTYSIPTLVIDDADPESADRERDDRGAVGKETRLSFLPPILLDREDRSARQGGLTLAIIVLLIAATLTLSYLMRRPSASGDGVTMIDGSSELLS